ncbi:MAG: calcium/sodium antiporter [Merismopedia sp. SIO2A8]|nr:calcium/sodium antiporter [Symploca sp. SIO2B6]NET47537.1 calcium/sodium antiporter [Merismopedia sp. SIO2A8]
MDMTALRLLVLGLVLLVAGAEILVRGASKLAMLLGISPLIIGLTIVAYGTSAPEMAVSLQANGMGEAGISIGNVVGSNICNVLFILGISAMIAPLLVDQQLVKLDVPIMIGVSLFLVLLVIDGTLGRLDGILLFLGAVIYTIFLFSQGREDDAEEYDPEETKRQREQVTVWIQNIGLIVLGGVLLTQGSNWLVDGAVSIAQAFGLSNLVIGLTIIALGTSLPEAATSVIASLKGERDIAVGNVVGSNIFNILAVLGVAGLFSPTGIAVSEAALSFDIPVMIAVAIACLPIFFSGSVISRWEGIVFFAYYIAYMCYLVLDATNHDSLTYYSAVLGRFVIPITVITLFIIIRQEIKQHKL